MKMSKIFATKSKRFRPDLAQVTCLRKTYSNCIGPYHQTRGNLHVFSHSTVARAVFQNGMLGGCSCAITILQSMFKHFWLQAATLDKNFIVIC